MARAWAPLLILALTLSGCATIFSGGPDSVNFGSKPEGAEVLVNGQSMGSTPVTLRLEPSKTYMITYRKEGFGDATVVLSTHVQPGFVVLDVLAGIMGVAIDAATGDWRAFDQGEYYVELKSK